MGLDRKEITPEKSFIDDLGLDSLDVMTLAMAIEEDFDIEVPDDDVEGIRTVQDVFDYLHKKLDM
jgi:acyl carrier protein